MYKKILLSILLMGCFAGSAFAFDTDELNLIHFINETDSTIDFIFLSPGDSEEWGSEILGTDRVLKPGDSIGFYIHYPNECDEFDIMAVDEYGETLIIWGYEICDYSEETIKIRREYFTEYMPDMTFVEIYINNETVPIHHVFISPFDSDVWGVDYLDKETILDTYEKVSFLFPAYEDPTEYNLLGIDEDGDSYEFSFSVDLDSDGLMFSIELSDML